MSKTMQPNPGVGIALRRIDGLISEAPTQPLAQQQDRGCSEVRYIAPVFAAPKVLHSLICVSLPELFQSHLFPTFLQCTAANTEAHRRDAVVRKRVIPNRLSRFFFVLRGNLIPHDYRLNLRLLLQLRAIRGRLSSLWNQSSRIAYSLVK